MATVGGAVGCGYVGNQVERNNPQMTWQIAIHLNDGTLSTVRQTATPIVRPGDRVRITGTGLELIGRS